MACRRSGVRISLAPRSSRSRIGPWEPKRERAPTHLGAFLVSEDGVHGGGACGDHGLELMPVDLLGHDRRAVADEVGYLLDSDSVVTHDRHERAPKLSGRPALPRPAALVMRRNERRTLAASSTMPTLVQNTKSLSCHAFPALSFCLACSAWCSLNVSATSSGISRVRRGVRRASDFPSAPRRGSCVG
jgi:hypothetical protein